MKKIEAVIKPFKLAEVSEAIMDVGVQGMYVSEVRGFGRQRGHTEIYRGSEYSVEFVPKLTVTVVVPNKTADQVVQAILRTAKTGKIGDGKIFVSPVERAVRVRTGEEGEDAVGS